MRGEEIEISELQRKRTDDRREPRDRRRGRTGIGDKASTKTSLDQLQQRAQSESKASLFKPHGSVNWVRLLLNDTKIPKGQSAEATEMEVTRLAGTEGLQLGAGYTVVPDASSATLQNRTVIPALTIPVLEKRDFEFPPNTSRLCRSGFLMRFGCSSSVGAEANVTSFGYGVRPSASHNRACSRSVQPATRVGP